MELKGTFKDITYDFDTRKPIISFIVDEIADTSEIKDVTLDIKVTKYRRKRSLDANAYFHVLVDKLAYVMGTSRSWMKNKMISEYGQIWYMDDKALVCKTNIPPSIAHNDESTHMWLIKIGDDDAYWYKLYRPTHEYNSSEMHRLIQGTIEECKEQGIQTATPEEVEQMERLWKERYERSS